MTHPLISPVAEWGDGFSRAPHDADSCRWLAAGACSSWRCTSHQPGADRSRRSLPAPPVRMLGATGAGPNGAARHATARRQPFRGLAVAGFAAAMLLLWGGGPVWCAKRTPNDSTTQRSACRQETCRAEGGFATSSSHSLQRYLSVHSAKALAGQDVARGACALRSRLPTGRPRACALRFLQDPPHSAPRRAAGVRGAAGPPAGRAAVPDPRRPAALGALGRVARRRRRPGAPGSAQGMADRLWMRFCAALSITGGTRKSSTFGACAAKSCLYSTFRLPNDAGYSAQPLYFQHG